MTSAVSPPDSGSVRVLMLGRDRAFFAADDAPFADVRARHRRYAAALRARAGQASELRILCLSGRGAGCRTRRFPEGLTLIPTRSLHRATFGLGLVRRLPGALRRWRPDVVTAQTPWGEGVLAWLVARLTGAAFLPQVHFDLFSPHLAAELRPVFWRPWVAHFLLRRADGIRVVSHAVAEALAARLGIARGRIFVVPVPVAPAPLPSAFSRAEARAGIAPGQGDGPVVLFAGRFVAVKNLALWVAVAEAVADRVPGVRFVLAGDGPDRAGIARRIAESRHRARFHLPGAVGGSGLAGLYRAADAFLLTSNHEGFARVIVEAGLAGLPAVSTACAGPRELIVDGETGFLRPVGDRDALADAVIMLLRDPDLAARLGARARARMEAEFGEARLVDRLIGCWIDAASQAPRSRVWS